jgi:MFS family permease
MCLLLVTWAFVFRVVPPVLTLMISELGLSHTQAGLLMSLFALPGIALAIPGGLLADRLGARAVVSFSLVLVILGAVIVATGHAFSLIGLGRLLAGIGGATLAVIAPRVVAEWFVGREIGTAMGIYNTAVPVGTLAAFNASAMLGSGLGWRSSIWSSTVLALLVLLAFLFLFPQSSARQRDREESQQALRSDFRALGLPVWLLGLAWMWLSAEAAAFTTFAPDFMVQQGSSIPFAGFASSLFMLGPLCFSVPVGYLTDRFGRKELFIGAGGLASAVFVLLFAAVPAGTVLFVIAAGVSIAFVPAPVFSLAADFLGRERLGLGYGVILTGQNLGAVLGPYLVGLTKDLTGSYTGAFAAASMMGALVPLTVVSLRLARRGPVHNRQHKA